MKALALSRRSLLRGTAGLVATAAVAPAVASCTSDPPADADATTGSTAGPPAGTASTEAGSSSNAAGGVFAELDAKIEAGMQAYAIPGVAVGVWYQGEEYLKGYGVTSLDSPQPVTADTIFRIGSTTKTFTGTAAMRLVEAGKLDLDGTVRTYLPDFTTSDPSVAEIVTVRQLLNHTPGWLGDDLEDFGRGDDAIAEYVASVADLPMVTPPGSTFFYNNTALVVAGRVIEAVNGTTYEQAVRDLVIGPLQLNRTGFFTEDAIGYPIAASHAEVDGQAQLNTEFWYVPRSLDPTGALLSTARDQLQYARFHLGHVQAADGSDVLSAAALEAMRDDPGPGGTLLVELDGMGVSWQLRPSAEGVRIVQHGGDWPGQHSGFLFVPERDFAITMLTNSNGGPRLVSELFIDDWALRTFAGLHNLPATPATYTAEQLAPYEGRYTHEHVPPDGTTAHADLQLTAEDGGLRLRNLDQNESPLEPPQGTPASLIFYRDDYVLALDSDGKAFGPRANFVRGADGAVEWFRFGGRLSRRVV